MQLHGAVAKAEGLVRKRGEQAVAAVSGSEQIEPTYPVGSGLRRRQVLPLETMAEEIEGVRGGKRLYEPP